MQYTKVLISFWISLIPTGTGGGGICHLNWGFVLLTAGFLDQGDQLGPPLTDIMLFGSLRRAVGALWYWLQKQEKWLKIADFWCCCVKEKDLNFCFAFSHPFLDKKVTFLDKSGALDWLKWYTTSYKIGPNVYISFYSNYKMLS